MQLIRRLLTPRSARPGRNRFLRGLSTAELVGIIVVIGILGALGATYITGLVDTANTNTGNQNAVTLSTLANSFVESGGAIGTGTGQLDLTSPTTAITALNAGISAGNVTYQMTPTIATSSFGNYTVAQDATTKIITFAHTADSAP
jgi:hypothetical protein